jgi:hypothetical protein
MAAQAGLLGRRRRRADDIEPLLTFALMRRMRGREFRNERGELESDRHLRLALAQKAIEKMREDGVDTDAESDTPILDWIRDNWAFLFQALKDLISVFSGVPVMAPAVATATTPRQKRATATAAKKKR